MQIFQAKRKHPNTDADESVYIEADDRRAALATLRALGWDTAHALDAIPRGFDLPSDANIVRAADMISSRRRPLHEIAESSLIRRPIGTIALGIVLGWAMVVVIRLILMAVFGLFGVTFLGWTWN
ncbi:MAG: hypothetical protein AAFZ67_08010 [Planctomycetota bacterium]